MISARKPNAGIHAQFVVAVILAAGAGYLWGTMEQEKPAEETRSEASTRGRRERPQVERASSPAAGEFVQAVLEGAIGERQQWQHIRWFSEEEVKVAIRDLDRLQGISGLSPDLREMLFYRWAELDPVAANRAAADVRERAPFMYPFPRVRQAVIAAWINQGGAVAAWEAVREEHEVWACTRSVPGEVADMLVASLSDRNDMAAFKEVLRLDDDNCVVADVLCRARAGKASESPESRAAFLAAAATHPDSFVVGCAREQLFRKWAEKDVSAARAGVLTLSLDEQARRAVEGEIDRVERDKAREVGGEP